MFSLKLFVSHLEYIFISTNVEQPRCPPLTNIAEARYSFNH